MDRLGYPARSNASSPLALRRSLRRRRSDSPAAEQKRGKQIILSGQSDDAQHLVQLHGRPQMTRGPAGVLLVERYSHVRPRKILGVISTCPALSICPRRVSGDFRSCPRGVIDNRGCKAHWPTPSSPAVYVASTPYSAPFSTVRGRRFPFCLLFKTSPVWPAASRPVTARVGDGSSTMCLASREVPWDASAAMHSRAVAILTRDVAGSVRFAQRDPRRRHSFPKSLRTGREV
ncbi:hypothetical protein FKP32DRAFT_1328769 [Trametes sanguinea]|nr:hypothetical protein FKP32DRAFT_1328769 [Trametes sanguinea]